MELPVPPCFKSNTRLSYRDVVEVKHMLLHKLPYELVDIILENARCWAYMSTEHNSFLSIRATCSPNFNANYIISISKPISKRTKVKLVQFRIHSQECRTGYFTGSSRNPYDSYTWFEASILRPLGPHQSLSHSAMNMNSPLDVRKLGWMEISNPRDRRNRRWQVQANAIGAPSKFHYITWNLTYDDGEVMLDDECNSETGRGSGSGFIETLRPGDRIALHGRALFAGHENHVFSTKIEIAYQS